MGPYSLYCCKWRKISKSRRDLDLGPTMPNIELVRVIFIYFNVFKFQVPRSISFCIIVQTHIHTHTRARARALARASARVFAHTDSDE